MRSAIISAVAILLLFVFRAFILDFVVCEGLDIDATFGQCLLVVLAADILFDTRKPESTL